MLTKDAAETTGAVGEAPTLVVVLCLYLAAPVVLPTIAQTLFEFGILNVSSLSQTDVNLTIVHSNPLHYHQVTFFTDLSLQMLLFH